MDALPMEEKTGLPYASTVKVKNLAGETVPVGHMCGHDLHTSCLVGTARLLAQGKHTWFCPGDASANDRLTRDCTRRDGRRHGRRDQQRHAL